MNASVAAFASATGACRLMPRIGLGTFLMEPSQIASSLRSAIVQEGYRRIDCAPVYFNEEHIGDTLHQIFEDSSNDLQRSDLYIVSKLASPFHRNVEAGLRKTLLDLRLDYLDLYLIHWPVAFYPVPIPDRRGWENEDIDDSGGGERIDPSVSIHDTWKQMENLVDKGLVKQIGVSNFPVMLLHELLSKARIPPAVNQCESHPYLQQQHLINYCKARGVHFQAYSPLGCAGFKEKDGPALLQDHVLLRMAEKYQVAGPAQIAIAWALQRGTSVVVKSTHPQRQRGNLAASSVTLSKEDMEEIQSLNRNYRFFRPQGKNSGQSYCSVSWLFACLSHFNPFKSLIVFTLEWWGSMAMAVFD